MSERLSFTTSYLPPVEIIDHLRTHLAGIAVDYRLLRRGPWSAGLRLAVQWSEAEGDFTVAEEIAGDPDPMRNPYGGQEPSRDVFTSWTFGLEASLSWQLPVERPSALFVNAAYAYADLDFQVDAILAGGFHDTARLSTSGDLWSFGVGGRTAFSDRFSGTLALVYVPLDVRRRPELPVENDPLLHLRLTFNMLF